MKISSGIKKSPHFVLIWGLDKVGKTTFAADAPSPIIVGPEDGTRHIDVSRAEDIHTYEDVLSAIDWLQNEKHEFKTLGLDSLDWIEPLIWKFLCEKHKVENIEAFGFGKGYVLALEQWSDLIGRLKKLRDSRQMNIIVIAHSQVKTVNDPLYALPYDRHVLKLNDKASAKWREAVDAILFAAFEDTVFKVNRGDAKAKASDADGGNRKLFTVRRAAYDAGNRLGLPPSLPLSYSAFAEAAEAGKPDSLEQVTADISEIIADISVKDAALASRISTAAHAAAADVIKLVKIRNHARSLVA